MKKAISLFLALVIMLSIAVPTFAAESSEEYYTIQVEYSDNRGRQESLDVMIQNDNVFVDAKMLAERLGYAFVENGEGAVIYNKDTSNGLPIGITQFKYNSTQVSHMLFNNMIDTYKAPFASVKNSKGSWIPLEYSLLLLNSGLMITDDALLIDIPTKKIIDYFYDIAKNGTKYSFDWADYLGFTEADIKVRARRSHLVNVVTGLFDVDGASWAALFQQFIGSSTSYDKKYGEDLAMLICTESDKELQATTKKVKELIDVFDEDGKLGQMLSDTSAVLDSQVKDLYENCEDILEKVKYDNLPLVSYNRSYQALEKALDKQTWFTHTGGNILDVQKGVSSAAGKTFTFLDVCTKVLEVVGYAQEFQNQDEFSLAALKYYLETANGGMELPKAMKASMIDYSDTLSSSIGKYTTKRFFENVDNWILKEIPLHKVLGIQATALLFAWNIASNTIPFIANGLSAADSFELALYSLVFQGDAFLNYQYKRNFVFSDIGNITAENMYDISQYCHIYLKSCYITREAALASLPLICEQARDDQNNINTEIAEILIGLKEANKNNDGCVFGFLPSDNEVYLGKYNDSQLIAWVRTIELVTDADIDMPDNAVEFNGHHYYVYNMGTGITWEEAKQYCESQGGYLATITSPGEQAFISDLVQNQEKRSYWVGLTDEEESGNWKWVNDEPFSYSNWGQNEPNHGYGGKEHYVAIVSYDTKYDYPIFRGEWNDHANDRDIEQFGFICEWGEYTVAAGNAPAQEPIRTTSDERDIVLVLDVSGSMAGTPMEETKKASTNFVETILEEDASIGIVTYDNSANCASDFSVNKDLLKSIVSGIYDGGGTNIEAGLMEANSMLNTSNAKKKIIVLMSDGMPNDGKEGDDLIAYADKIKDSGVIVYTLGFFEDTGDTKSSAQVLMEGIASDGCHYEVANADDLVFFFGDIADQLNGQKYIYVRIACPVDVSVTYKGQTLNSAESDLSLRTDFGTLTFEENEESTAQGNSDDRIKVLRLKEGVDYDLKITGTGRGLMDYTIGFMDDDGTYSDLRRFEKVKITKQTVIDTVATNSQSSVLNIDHDGDGKYDLKLRAEENGYGKEVKQSYIPYVIIIGAVLLMCVFGSIIAHKRRKRKDMVK